MALTRPCGCRLTAGRNCVERGAASSGTSAARMRALVDHEHDTVDATAEREPERTLGERGTVDEVEHRALPQPLHGGAEHLGTGRGTCRRGGPFAQGHDAELDVA